MELATAYPSVYKDKDITWYNVNNILQGYDDYTVQSVLKKIGKRYKKNENNINYVNDKGVKLLCYYILGEKGGKYEKRILSGKLNDVSKNNDVVTIDNVPVKQNSPDIESLKKDIDEIKNQINHIISLMEPAPYPPTVPTPIQLKKKTVDENKLTEKIQEEPDPKYWSSWCCIMINQLYADAKSKSNNLIDRGLFYYQIYAKLNKKFNIDLKKMKKDNKTSYISIIGKKKEWRKALVKILLLQAELAGVPTHVYDFEKGLEIPMVKVS